MKLGVCDIRPGPSPFPRGSEKLVPSSADMDAAGFVMKPSEASAVPMRSPSPGGEGKRQSNWPLRIPVAAGLLILLFALLCITPPVLAQTNLIVIGQSANPPTVGMEGQLDVALPLTGLITKPGDHRAPLVLRIADTQPHGTFTRYDLRYVGRVPGPHDLRDYLFTAEGELATNLPALKVTVHGLLPKPHSGWLEEEAHHAPTLFSGYRGILIVIGALWVVAFFVIRRIDRKPKPATPAAETTAEPTFAERLRPLVERAAAGQLTAAEKATLERMLITYWQQRLNLTNAGGDLIQQLRQHAEAGELLHALEAWLHRPPGRGSVQVDEILAPYRNLPEPAAHPTPA